MSSRDEKDKVVGVKYTRSSSPAAYWEVIYTNRLDENRWEEGDGRGLTNDTWLPDDPVGLNAGRTPQTVPAATWNCLVSTHVAFKTNLGLSIVTLTGEIYTRSKPALENTPSNWALCLERLCVTEQFSSLLLQSLCFQQGKCDTFILLSASFVNL